MKWKSGRQAATQNIKKLCIWSKWRFDIYLLSIGPKTYIEQHVDPVSNEFNHHRLNITLKGLWCFGYIINKRHKFVKHKAGSWLHFRPDIMPHWAYSHTQSYILSIGWITKK